MTQTYFNEMMEALGCRVVRGLALGLNEKQMPYSAQLTRPGASPVISIRYALDGPASPCLAYFSEKPVQYCTPLSYGDILEFTLTLPTDFFAKATIYAVNKEVIAACSENGLEQAHICPLCGQPQCDSLVWLATSNRDFSDEQAYFPVHSACLETRLEAPEKDWEKPLAVPGSYLMGALGALLGAVIGIIPNWVQLISKHKVSAILYFLVPIFSGLLYRLLRGKRNHTYASICIALSSILVAFGFEQFGLNYTLRLMYDTYISYFDSIKAFFTGNNWGDTIRRMLTGLVCMFIGFVPASRLLQGYSRRGQVDFKLIRGADFTRESAISLAKALAAPIPDTETQNAPNEVSPNV